MFVLGREQEADEANQIWMVVRAYGMVTKSECVSEVEVDALFVEQGEYAKVKVHEEV